MAKSAYNYTAVITGEDGDYHAELPNFPGCVGDGPLQKAATDGMKRMLSDVGTRMIEDGKPFPKAFGADPDAPGARYSICMLADNDAAEAD